MADSLPGAEQILEMDIADVAGVVVARHHQQVLALDLVQVALGQQVFLLEALVGEVAGDDHDVGLELVELDDGAVHEVGHEILRTRVHVGDMGDDERFGLCCGFCPLGLRESLHQGSSILLLVSSSGKRYSQSAISCHCLRYRELILFVPLMDQFQTLQGQQRIDPC